MSNLKSDISLPTPVGASATSSPPPGNQEMSTAPAPEMPPTSTTTPGFRPYRVTLERYHRMIATGVYTEKDPVVLWNGQLVEKMTKGQPHNNAVARLARALFRIVPDGWHVRQEQPIVLSDDSEPEPDLTVIRGAIDDYPDRPPLAHDVVLLIEAADSSLPLDSGEVLETYAKNAIPCYWLVNLPDRRIEVYSKPEGARFTVREVFGPDDTVPVILDGREVGRVAVRDVLPSSHREPLPDV